MKKIFRRSGFSLPEIIVVISIIATLLVIILPIIGNVKRRVYAHQCASQLKQIGIALKLYEQDFGALPYFLDKLAPFYVSPSLLICPWVKANIPQQIFEKCVDLEKAIREGSYLSTYFYFYQPSLDDFYRRGIVPISYSHILQMRGDATPIVYCQEHRHPYIIVCHPKLFRPRWFFPRSPHRGAKEGWECKFELQGQHFSLDRYTGRRFNFVNSLPQMKTVKSRCEVIQMMVRKCEKDIRAGWK